MNDSFKQNIKDKPPLRIKTIVVVQEWKSMQHLSQGHDILTKPYSYF